MGNEVESLKKMEDYTDRMQEDISAFLARCAQQNLNTASARNVNAMIRIAHELETIGDSCFNLMILAERRYDAKIAIPDQVVSELDPYTDVVVRFISFIKEHLNRHLSQEELETGLVPLNISPVNLTDTFEVDTFSLTSFYDYADWDPSSISLRAGVRYDFLYFEILDEDEDEEGDDGEDESTDDGDGRLRRGKRGDRR